MEAIKNDEFVIFSEPIEKKVEEEFNPFEDSFYIEKEKPVDEKSIFEDSFYIKKDESEEKFYPFEEKIEEKIKVESYSPFECIYVEDIEDKTLEVDEQDRDEYFKEGKRASEQYIQMYNAYMDSKKIKNPIKKIPSFVFESHNKSRKHRSSTTRKIKYTIGSYISNVKKATEDSFYKIGEVLSIPYHLIRHNVKKLWRNIINKVDDKISKKQIQKTVKKIQKEKLKKLSEELKKQNEVVNPKHVSQHSAEYVETIKEKDYDKKIKQEKIYTLDEILEEYETKNSNVNPEYKVDDIIYEYETTNGKNENVDYIEKIIFEYERNRKNQKATLPLNELENHFFNEERKNVKKIVVYSMPTNPMKIVKYFQSLFIKPKTKTIDMPVKTLTKTYRKIG